MELLITNRSRLMGKHGEAGWSEIQSALNEYLDSLDAAGTNASLFQIDGTNADRPEGWAALKALIGRLRAQHQSNYLLFLGGPDIVPFYPLPDRTIDQEQDREILSDSYYVDFAPDDQDHWPEMAVGRMPDGNPRSNLLAAQLRRAAAIHRAGRLPRPTSSAGFSARTWANASTQVYADLKRLGGKLSLCPPAGLELSVITGVTELVDSALFAPKKVFYFNLHGGRGKSTWWGEQRILNLPIRYPNLLNPQFLRQVDLTDSVFLCQACHGAGISGLAVEDSLALSALERGSVAFFGCTVKSYAVSLPDGSPSGGSGIEALFKYLIDRLVNDRMSFGDALKRTKQYYQFHNAYDEKNILGLVLLGDPLLGFQQ